MSTEIPSLLPPDDLLLHSQDDNAAIPICECQLLGHNVAADGKADPLTFDDPYFVYLYRHNETYFVVRGLNPEMMNGEEIPAQEADDLLARLPYPMD
jgi:hypothetical protein